MIIHQLEVRNYRSVLDVSIGLDGLTYLVGRNGAGKSTLLNALGVFFGRLKVAEWDWTYGRTEEPIEVSITFSDLGPAATEFQRYVRNDLLRVTKRIRLESGKPVESFHGSSLAFRGFTELRKLGAAQKLAAYRALRDELGLPTATSGAGVDTALEGWEAGHADDLELLEDAGNFFGYRNVAAGKLDRYVDFVLVPAVRDAMADASEGRDSTLKLLVDAVVRRSIDLAVPLDELRERVGEEYGRLLRRPEMSLADVQARVTRAMQRYAPGAEVAFRWDELDDTRLPEPTVLARLIDDGVEGEVSTKGHGLQRAYVMATLQALAEAESARGEQAEGGNPRGLVLAVEEPELYQHPAQARRIAATFADLTVDNSGIQVIACTHSPVFLDVSSFDRLRLVRKPTLANVARTSIAQASLAELAMKLTEIHQDGRTRSAAGLRPGLVGLLNPYVNEAFFADFVVLVEGEEDKALTEAALAQALETPELQRRAITVVPVGGKKNLDKMHSILAALNIPTYVMFDRDGEGGEERSQVEHWNRALQRMLGEPNPEPMPETRVGETYAILSPHLTQVVKSELGEEAWMQLRQQVCDELGLDLRRGVEKNAVVVRRLLALAEERGSHALTLETLAKSVAAAAAASFGTH